MLEAISRILLKGCIEAVRERQIDQATVSLFQGEMNALKSQFRKRLGEDKARTMVLLLDMLESALIHRRAES